MDSRKTNDTTGKIGSDPAIHSAPLRQGRDEADDGSRDCLSIRPEHQHGLAHLSCEVMGERFAVGGEPVPGGLRGDSGQVEKAAGIHPARAVRPPAQEPKVGRKAAMQVHKLKTPRSKLNTLRARVDEYLQFVSMTCSFATWNKYRGVINKFERFVAENNIREISAQAVMKYFLKLTSEGRKKSYLKTSRTILNLFFAWANRMGYMDQNPASAIPERAVDEPPKTPRAITEAEYDSLRIASIGSELHYAIVCAWHTGMRISDICALAWSDVDLANGIISVSPIKTRGRSRKRAIIPIHPQLAEVLSARAMAKLPIETYVSEYLASKHRNRAGDIYDQLREVASRVGVEVSGFHAFRHAAIRRWLEHPNADAVTVASMSGHASIESLAVYSDPSILKKKLLMGIPNGDANVVQGKLGSDGEDRERKVAPRLLRPEVPPVVPEEGTPGKRVREDDNLRSGDETRET